MPEPLPPLTLLETRVLGVLVEKERTVPDTYPLTLNALAAGCNQKTSRDPVLEASEHEVQAAVDHLRRRSLVIESSGGRTMRYAHNVKRVLEIPTEAVALLATLMLRGPQTAGELRLHSERLHRFSDISSVEGYLGELATRAAGPLVRELARAPGARETRWCHLLGDAPAEDALPVHGTEAPPSTERAAHPARGNERDTALAALQARVDGLESELGELRRTVDALRRALGT